MEFVGTDLEGRCRYQHHMNNSYDSAHTYRLHQDTLRWNLFAGMSLCSSGSVDSQKSSLLRQSFSELHFSQQRPISGGLFTVGK
jgi:hypothetical protein